MPMVFIEKRNIDNAGFFFGLLGFLFNCACIFGSYWGTYGGSPWTCSISECGSLINSTRAFLIIGIIITFLSFFLDRVNKLRDIYGSKGKTHTIVAFLWIFSAICFIIALSCYTSAVTSNFKYGWSYALGWVGMVCQLIGAGLWLYWRTL